MVSQESLNSTEFDEPISRRPSVLFINQYYWPDHASTAQHLSDLAEDLGARGFDCQVICGRGSYRSGQSRLPRREVRNRVTIHRVDATSFGRANTVRRMFDYLTFYLGAFLLALRLPKTDLVVTLTTPPLIGLIGTVLRWLRRSKHVYWSMDLHPDASIALRRMDPRWPLPRLLQWLSNAVIRKADRIVVLGPYMADRIQAKGVDQDRIVEIPVWSRASEVFPIEPEQNKLRSRLHLQDYFVVMYSGNLGLAHSASEFITAAIALKGHPKIRFVFVGGGPRMEEVKRAKETEGLDDLLILDYVPREQLFESLSLADLHLISMRPEMTGIVVPGKLYGIMASGRPALFVGPDHSETADTIREFDCGRTIRFGDPDSLIAQLQWLASDPEHAFELGANGRRAFLDHFEREHCCDGWAALLSRFGAANPERLATVAAVRVEYEPLEENQGGFVSSLNA